MQNIYLPLCGIEHFIEATIFFLQFWVNSLISSTIDHKAIHHIWSLIFYRPSNLEILEMSVRDANLSHSLTLKLPDKLQPYGLYVYYVVHICDFGMLRVNNSLNMVWFWYCSPMHGMTHIFIHIHVLHLKKSGAP